VNNEERINNLKKLGYTDREAEFVCFAALHSGYFVRRQFLYFIDKCRGQIAASFIDRTVQNGHSKAIRFRGDRTVYHLSSKIVYRALGDPDNRNRRAHEIVAIKNRLMAREFVVQNRPHQFLSTETEKTSYFCGYVKIGREHLPFKRYRSSTTRSTTDRYFVDKFPIFASCVEPGEPAIPHFCYIDEGQHSTSRFEQYLQEYRTLLARLTRFRVIYISSSKDQFEVSRKVFERMILSPSGCVPKDPFVDRLIGFFHDRAAYENRDFTRFDQAKLIQFRADRAAFTGQQYEEMFGEWKAHGDSAVVARLCPEVLPKAGTAGEFGTYLLRFNYDLFGTLLNGRREPNTCTKATA